jgi:hypothetical protein
MENETGQDMVETIIMEVEKVQTSKNWELAAQNIKNKLDKKFEFGWQVVVGEAFTCQVGQENCLHILYGYISILCFK